MKIPHKNTEGDSPAASQSDERADYSAIPRLALSVPADCGGMRLDQVLAQPEGTKLMLLAPVIRERKGEHLSVFEELRAQGEDFPQTAQAYVASWLADGYLERRFPAGASEEEYELSTAAVEAIRFVSGLAQPHSAATESRLTLVIEALARLAEDTDTDKFRRIDRLMAAHSVTWLAGQNGEQELLVACLKEDVIRRFTLNERSQLEPQIGRAHV